MHRINVAVLGAVVANAVMFLTAFGWGACFGAVPAIRSSDVPIEFGLQGGRHAVGFVILVCMFTAGLVPLVVSGVGIVIALLIVPKRKSNCDNP